MATEVASGWCRPLGILVMKSGPKHLSKARQILTTSLCWFVITGALCATIAGIYVGTREDLVTALFNAVVFGFSWRGPQRRVLRCCPFSRHSLPVLWDIAITQASSLSKMPIQSHSSRRPRNTRVASLSMSESCIGK